MARFVRGLLMSLVATSGVMVAVSLAQDEASSSVSFQGAAPADHSLKLVLSQDQTPESQDSSALKTCQAHHPPPACVLLTLVLKNEGRETILSWWSTCGVISIGFDLLKTDGKWEPFPIAHWTCASTVAGVESLPPGKDYVVHLRLADQLPFLEMDTSRVDALLSGLGEYTIRARWEVWGCVASDKLKPGSSLELFTASSLCVDGTEPKQRFVVLQSNPLKLPANLPRP